MKISILGYSGSGKSTLANKISNTYEIPLLHLDQVNFIDNWQERDKKEALEIVDNFMKQESWVIDGNYSKFKKIDRLGMSDIIIFMNFNRFNCLFRTIKRYFKYKGKVRDSAANNCKEKLDFEFIKWILIDSRSKQKIENYNNMKKYYANKWIEISNQKELDIFIDNLRKI